MVWKEKWIGNGESKEKLESARVSWNPLQWTEMSVCQCLVTSTLKTLMIEVICMKDWCHLSLNCICTWPRCQWGWRKKTGKAGKPSVLAAALYQQSEPAKKQHVCDVCCRTLGPAPAIFCVKRNVHLFLFCFLFLIKKKKKKSLCGSPKLEIKWKGILGKVVPA